MCFSNYYCNIHAYLNCNYRFYKISMLNLNIGLRKKSENVEKSDADICYGIL